MVENQIAYANWVYKYSKNTVLMVIFNESKCNNSFMLFWHHVVFR